MSTLVLVALGLLAVPTRGPQVGSEARTITIANAGFEALYLGGNLPAQYGGVVPAGTFPTGAPPAGWSAWYATGGALPGTFLGVLNPGTAAQFVPNPSFFIEGAPEGDNAVLLYTSGDAGGPEYGVEQTLGEVLRPLATYRLSVQVGNIGSATALLPPYSNQGFYDLDGFPGYRLQLLAGGVVIAEDVDSVRPPERRWARARLAFTAGRDHPQLGQPLGVRLVNRNRPDVPGVTGIEVDFDDVRLRVSRKLVAGPRARPMVWLRVLGFPLPFPLAVAVASDPTLRGE